MKTTTRLWLLIALQVSAQLPVVLVDLRSNEPINQSSYITYTVTQPTIVPVAPTPKKSAQIAIVPTAEANTIKAIQRPTSLQLPMQFYSQAPHGNWADPYQNACEEMSLLLAHGFLTNTQYTKEEVDTAVVALTQYVAAQGFEESMPLEAVQYVAQTYLGSSSIIIENPTIEDIEKSIQAGYPVIAPLAGRTLNNPHFMGAGPWYHMLVISGYNESEFITQEVGTNYGANYTYSKDVIMDSLHDYTGVDEEIETGLARVLVLIPN